MRESGVQDRVVHGHILLYTGSGEDGEEKGKTDIRRMEERKTVVATSKEEDRHTHTHTTKKKKKEDTQQT